MENGDLVGADTIEDHKIDSDPCYVNKDEHCSYTDVLIKMTGKLIKQFIKKYLKKK